MGNDGAARLPRAYRLAAEEQHGSALIENAEQSLGNLVAQVKAPDNRQLRWHLREHILPGLAIYRALRAAGASQEAALAAFDKVIRVVVDAEARRMARLGRLPWVHTLLRLVLRPAMRKYPAQGWQIEWLENSRDAIRFNMRSCYYFDTLSHCGAPELTASFCHGDDLIYERMSPHVEWRRAQTIGRGGKYCDFCFARTARSARADRRN
jgi:hypothetical protein